MKKTIFIATVIGLFLPIISHADFQTNLKYGMSGTDVSSLQDLLVSEDCLTVSPTGYFGLATLKGVKCFQSKYSVSPVSGYFGALSRAQANKVIAEATSTSDQAEIAETGTTTTITQCTNGARFNTVTGQSCVSPLANELTQLQNQVNQLQTAIQNQPVVSTPITNVPNTGTVNTPVVPETVTAIPYPYNYSKCIPLSNMQSGSSQGAIGQFSLSYKNPISISNIDLTINNSEDVLRNFEFWAVDHVLAGKAIDKSTTHINTAVSNVKLVSDSSGPNWFNLLGEVHNYGSYDVTVNSITLSDGRTVQGLPIDLGQVTISECK